MSKKVNPRRVPASQADLKKAKKEATDNAVTFCWAILFTVMRDKEGWGEKRLRRLWREVNALSDSIDRGYVSIPDLVDTLKREGGIELK